MFNIKCRFMDIPISRHTHVDNHKYSRQQVDFGCWNPPISATPRNSRPTKMKYQENLVECIGAIRELEARMKSVVACFTIDTWYMFTPISGCQRSYMILVGEGVVLIG